MIYNIIVDTQPAPPDVRGWDMHLVVELEIDSNLQLKDVCGEGVILRFDLEGDDWSIPAITEHITEKIQEDLEEKLLEEAKKAALAFMNQLNDSKVDFSKIGHVDLQGKFHPARAFLMERVKETIEKRIAVLGPRRASESEWEDWRKHNLDILMADLEKIIPES